MQKILCNLSLSPSFRFPEIHSSTTEPFGSDGRSVRVHSRRAVGSDSLGRDRGGRELHRRLRRGFAVDPVGTGGSGSRSHASRAPNGSRELLHSGRVRSAQQPETRQRGQVPRARFGARRTRASHVGAKTRRRRKRLHQRLFPSLLQKRRHVYRYSTSATNDDTGGRFFLSPAKY